MAKVRNVSGDERTLRDLRVVGPDCVIEVAEADLPGFECQPRIWRVETSRKATNATKDEVA